MSDISIPGITDSKYKTDKIIAGLVKAKEIQLDRMEEDRDKLELKRDVWQSINILTNRLENAAQNLFNVDSPFRQKFSLSSNESVLSVTNSRQAENGEYTVRVLQVADKDSLRSDEITNDFQVPGGKYTFGSGEDAKSFSFKGGTLRQFVTTANRQLHNLAQFDLINSRGQKQVLVLRSVNSGVKHRLRFADQGKQLAENIGLILDAGSLRVDLLHESLISPFNELSDYKFSESKNEVSVGPGQELRISLPNSYTVRSGSVMRYDIQSPRGDLPPISNTPDNTEGPPKTYGAETESAVSKALSVQDGEGLENSGYSRFSSRDAGEIPPPPSAEFDDIRIDSAGSDTAFIGIDPGVETREQEETWIEAETVQALQKAAEAQAAAQQVRQAQQVQQFKQSDQDLLNPTANFFLVQNGLRVSGGPKNGEVQASAVPHEEILALRSINNLHSIQEVIIRNPNPDREIVVRNLRFEDAEIKDDYLPKHPISVAQNAQISYLGVETQRADNSVDDLLPGLTLNLKKAKPDEDIIIRTEPDYDTIIEKVTEFVASYNELLTQLNVVYSGDDAVIREKTSFTEKQEEEARRVLGLMRGDSNINNLKYRLVQSVSDGYPTEQGTRVLADIGISTNLSGFQSGLDQSKLRGYLEFDTDVLRDAMTGNFAMVQDLFGRDNDGDYAVDSGSALEVQRISQSYTRVNGPIPYQVQDLERSIENSEDQIANYKDYLVDYEDGLKRKYGRMEGALNQMEQQQQALRNFSEAMNSK